MRKTSNNKFGYGIEAFPKTKYFLFHIPSKLNVLQSIPLFFFPKDNHLKKQSCDLFKFKW
jgi:hypothetical protein